VKAPIERGKGKRHTRLRKKNTNPRDGELFNGEKRIRSFLLSGKKERASGCSPPTFCVWRRGASPVEEKKEEMVISVYEDPHAGEGLVSDFRRKGEKKRVSIVNLLQGKMKNPTTILLRGGD